MIEKINILAFSLVASVFFSANAQADSICDYRMYQWPSELPEDFRWTEDEINQQTANESIQYFSALVNGDLSKYHYISFSHAKEIIEGFTFKQMALKELKEGNNGSGDGVAMFCSWLVNSVKTD